jgi:hypothetical protein
MDWTVKDVAKRILDETSRTIGEDVRERNEAIVMTWLDTLLSQQHARCAKIAASFDEQVPGGFALEIAAKIRSMGE